MSLLVTLGLLLAGAAPSLIWLSFFLREDCRPEPKSLLAKTFLMGIITAPLAIVFQLLFACGAELVFSGGACIQNGSLAALSSTSTPLFFLWAAGVEEVVKFYAVKKVALNSPEFDEPTDGMIYMITAALGFAAMENILVVFRAYPAGLGLALNTLALRFFGATLLHALASGLLGYFLANAWLFDHHKKKLIWIGLGIATFFHFTFNILLASFESQMTGLLYATLLLGALSLLIYSLFLKVRKRYCELRPKDVV